MGQHYETIDFYSLQENDRFCKCDFCGIQLLSGDMDTLKKHLKKTHSKEVVLAELEALA